MLLQQKQQQQLQQLAMAATSTYIHTYVNVNTCACVVYVGLLISFLLGYVLCEITQVQPTVIFVEVCFVSVPKAVFYCLSLSLSLFLYLALLHFLIIVFIVFTLSYVCKFLLLLRHFLLIFCNNYLPWHFIAFLHISFICSIMLNKNNNIQMQMQQQRTVSAASSCITWLPLTARSINSRHAVLIAFHNATINT